MKLRISAIVAIALAIGGGAVSAYALGQRSGNASVASVVSGAVSVAVDAARAADTESYEPCTDMRTLGTTFPCVWTDSYLTDKPDALWFLASDSESQPTEFQPCATEDGPAPCVWDTVTRGNGTAGPGVSRFVIIRD